jgi:CBS domain-containing protein
MIDTRVRDVMTNLVLTFRRNDAIGDATRRLSSNRVSGAPVVEDGRVVGVVSEADLLRAYTSGGLRSPGMALPLFLLRATPPPKPAAETVGEVMTEKVVTVGPEETVGRAAALLARHGVRRLPVVDDDGYLMGIVARADLVRCMADAAVEGLSVSADA